jgi:hypothetical protein
MTTANSAGRIEALNGIPIYFEVHRNGEPLLLLHGFSGCSQGWLQLMRGEVSGGRYKGSESKRDLALARPVGGKIKVNPPFKTKGGGPNFDWRHHVPTTRRRWVRGWRRVRCVEGGSRVHSAQVRGPSQTFRPKHQVAPHPPAAEII